MGLTRTQVRTGKPADGGSGAQREPPWPTPERESSVQHAQCALRHCLRPGSVIRLISSALCRLLFMCCSLHLFAIERGETGQQGFCTARSTEDVRRTPLRSPPTTSTICHAPRDQHTSVHSGWAAAWPSGMLTGIVMWTYRIAAAPWHLAGCLTPDFAALFVSAEILGCQDAQFARILGNHAAELPRAQAADIEELLITFWISTHKHRKVLWRHLDLMAYSGLAQTLVYRGQWPRLQRPAPADHSQPDRCHPHPGADCR